MYKMPIVLWEKLFDSLTRNTLNFIIFGYRLKVMGVMGNHRNGVLID